MFTAKRYAIKGIATEVSLDFMLWVMIDTRKKKGIQIDYLQLFELSITRKDGIAIQRVVHK
jgi:hypothetical protein